ncbi:HPr family phosphocarrier protein [Lysinibacillus sp. NPDC096418]|uniref:HPr family phosphocarrier protein n=1 Tax=Lysinibacillus sp. NPDC096418 TaxID=3364138 RepID=UPI0038023F76
MKKSYKITAAEGLHARPTTLLVTAVTPFESEVSMTYKEKTVNLKSIMGVMALGVSPGSVVDISAEGSDAEALINKVTEVITSNGIGEEC